MQRKTLFQRLLLLILLACLLTAGLSGIIYSVTGVRMMANQIAMEMLPWANAISRLGERYYRGQLSLEAFLDLSVREQRDANIYIFDEEGEILAYTDSENSDAALRHISSYTDRMLSDQRSIVSINWRSPAGIFVGTPIPGRREQLRGMVFISKPRSDVRQIMGSMTASLSISCVLSLLAMVPLAYLISRRFSEPVRQMTNVARAMTEGDFSKKAEQGNLYELHLLGGALNQLSGALDQTIEELRQAKDRLQTILQGLGEGVIALEQGEISYYNQAAAALLGVSDNMDSVRQELVPFLPMIEQAQRSGNSEKTVVKKGNTALHVIASPYGDAAEHKNIVLLLQDISQYERLEQTRRDYVANVSHELRTPISSIRSLAETLNDGLIKNDETKNRYYGYILRESMRLSRLINDLLELSRLQSGRLSMEKEAFDPALLLQDVVERTSITASYSGISLDYEVKTLPMVFSNRDRIEQVLVALLDNAIKYCTDDGHVRVDTMQAEERLHILIRNTGSFAEQDLPHLFERFYKADTAHTGEGTGLGLAIVREVLTSLNEEIRAYNDQGEAVMEFTLSKA